jgi:hypothetical protein
MIRVVFGGNGWGGPRFSVTLDEFKDDNDTVVELNGIKIVFETRFSNILNGSKIEYTDFWLTRGFYLTGSRIASCWWAIKIPTCGDFLIYMIIIDFQTVLFINYIYWISF